MSRGMLPAYAAKSKAIMRAVRKICIRFRPLVGKIVIRANYACNSPFFVFIMRHGASPVALCGAQMPVKSSHFANMENQETATADAVPAPETAPVPETAPAPVIPTEDSRNRLTAAREFACEQYERLRHATAAQMESVRAYTQEARRQINEGWDVTCSRAREFHKAGEDFVRANPTATTLGALGVGVILGLLIGGRRH